MVLLLLAKVADKVQFGSADLTEYYRRDIVFNQDVIVHLSGGSSSYLCSARSLTAWLICGLLHTDNKQMRRPDRFLYAVPSHFIHHDKSLSNSKQSYRVFGVLTCLIVMLYLFEFHWRYCGTFYVKCWICYAIRLCSDDKNGF